MDDDTDAITKIVYSTYRRRTAYQNHRLGLIVARMHTTIPVKEMVQLSFTWSAGCYVTGSGWQRQAHLHEEAGSESFCLYPHTTVIRRVHHHQAQPLSELIGDFDSSIPALLFCAQTDRSGLDSLLAIATLAASSWECSNFHINHQRRLTLADVG